MKYLFWALLLIVQNAAFTWVSRARNSGSVRYHAIASVFSNGVWFVSQFLLVGIVVRDVHTLAQGVALGLLYTASTVVGSVMMHIVSLRWLEKGRRKVGG